MSKDRPDFADILKELGAHTVAETIAEAPKAEPPAPIVRELPPAPRFPLEALPPMMGGAVSALQSLTQAPVDIAANAILAVAALTAQSQVDVTLPTGDVKPVSLFLLTVAASGERKTSVDARATAGVRQREAELRDEASAQDEDVDGSEDKSAAPPVLMCEDATIEGLVKLLAKGHPSLGLFSSEGAMFVGGHGMQPDAKMRNAGGLSRLWDDGCLTRVRASDGVTAAYGRRLSMHLAVQPEVAARFLGDQFLLGQGLLSRFLIAAPESLQGMRRFTEPSDDAVQIMTRFNQKVVTLLRKTPVLRVGSTHELAPRAMAFSKAAALQWQEFYNAVETRLGPGGPLENCRELAAKLPEHAARLSAVLAWFEDCTASEVSQPAVAAAVALAEYFAANALRLHGAAAANQDHVEADRLLIWLQTKWPEPVVSIRVIVQRGPRSIRDSTRARRLVAILEREGHLRRASNGSIVDARRAAEAWWIKKAHD